MRRLTVWACDESLHNMDSQTELRKALKWCSLFASVALLTLSGIQATDQSPVLTTSPAESESETVAVPRVPVTVAVGDDADGAEVDVQVAESDEYLDAVFPEVDEEQACVPPAHSDADKKEKRFLILVSSVDGQLTAFNGKDGTIEWSVNTGTLVSSSISKIEINRKGIPMHLIPSLDGALYQFDGETIEPVPLGADILLSSSFRFNDDSMIVGGKETENYGIDVNEGTIRYICSMDGCQYKADSPTEDPKTAYLREEAAEDVLVISRHTKTIRAIEMRTGAEKWNFSVGQHELSFVSHSDGYAPSITHERDEEGECEIKQEDELHDECEDCYIEEDDVDAGINEEGETLPIDVKVIVPQGVIIGVSRDDPEKVLWQQKLNAAVADAWTLMDARLHQVSLFDADHNLALGSDDSEGDASPDSSLPSSPVIYVGMHDNQLYVQPSVQMQKDVQTASNQIMAAGMPNPHMPRVRWLPYLATASSRTPAVIAQKNPHLITHQVEAPEAVEEEHRLALWQRQYPYDNGYYLFSDSSPIQLPNASVEETENVEEFYNEEITVTLMNWWREVLVISIMMSILVHLILVKFCPPRRHAIIHPVPSSSASLSEGKEDSSETKEIEESSAKEQSPTLYSSRYRTDFEQVACLGKGGFGVVFQAKNRLDDCDYAIKRIALNNSDRAKQKVMREVKALAKLDHVGIVRYNQAWFECPPPGWQEEQDLLNADLHAMDSTPGATFTEYSPVNKEIAATSKSKSLTDFNPLRPFSADFPTQQTLTDISEISEVDNLGSSEGFTPGAGFSSDVSTSISSGVGFIHSDVPDDVEDDDSFGISFKDSSTETPFQPYIRQPSEISESFDIIFEEDKNDDQGVVTTKSCSTRPQTLRLSSVRSPSPGPPSVSASRIYLYIQMQMCQRESLKDWLSSNTLRRDRFECLKFFHQILCAVDYVHQCGLMHRDLKPSNIFFSMDGAIKVGDFGLVTALEENCEITPDEKSCNKNRSMRYTDQVGTELYMSPEQFTRHPYTQKVDIYALGMIFFELFYPFATQMERVKTLQDIRRLVFPLRFERELAKEFEVVHPMLSHDACKRPSSADLLQCKLLLNFEEHNFQRVRSTSRSRTISTSSSGSEILK